MGCFKACARNMTGPVAVEIIPRYSHRLYGASPLAFRSAHERSGAIFRRLLVIPDDQSPQGSVPSLAQDWGRRFSLPLHQIPREIIEETTHARGELFARTELCDLVLVGKGLTQAQKRQLLQEATQRGRPAVLMYPSIWEPPARVLLVDQGEKLNAAFLAQAAEICSRLRSVPILLTLARSERVGRARQELGRSVLAGFGWNVDCDLFAGWRIWAALASVARWRRCQLAIVELLKGSAWWQRFARVPPNWQTELAEKIPVLCLPKAANGASSGGRSSPNSTVEAPVALTLFPP